MLLPMSMESYAFAVLGAAAAFGALTLVYYTFEKRNNPAASKTGIWLVVAALVVFALACILPLFG